MPNSYVPRTHPNHLSNILGVHPDVEFNCAGYARTRGRRCLLRTYGLNRDRACQLLDEGTRVLNSGEECIDDILEELAPLVLCRRWHQYQAETLFHRWTLLVEKFVQRRRALQQLQPSTARQHDTSESSQSEEQQTPAESREQRDTPPRVEQTFIFEDRSTTQITQNIIIANINFVNTGRDATETRPGRDEPERQADTVVSEAGLDTPTSDTASSSVQRTTTTENSEPPTPSSPSNNGSPSTIEGPQSSRPVTRRPVEGDCTICFRSLRAAERESIGSNDSGYSSLHNDGSAIEGATSAHSEESQPLDGTDDGNDTDNDDIFSICFDRLETFGEFTNAEDEDSQTPTGDDDSDGNDGDASSVHSEAGDEASINDQNATENDNDGDDDCAFAVYLNEFERIITGQNADTQNPIEEENNGDDGDDSSGGLNESNVEEESSADENRAMRDEGELVWCRRCCGQNFHRDCIQEWVDFCVQHSRDPTCPICRAQWSVESVEVNG
ncbi:hypothetical protein VTN49DRAFT_2170 [Thermomyces lanuginosus]|uniref:uncharacterized protein n=1 Tax=Thermomyces lanuginosus TaxID=5541 RepID=UPI0037439BCD